MILKKQHSFLHYVKRNKVFFKIFTMFMIGTKPYFFRSEAITVWCDSSVSESTRLACYNVLIVKLVVLLKVLLKCLLIYLLYD